MKIYIILSGWYYSGLSDIVSAHRTKAEAKKRIKRDGFKYDKTHDYYLSDNGNTWRKIIETEYENENRNATKTQAQGDVALPFALARIEKLEKEIERMREQN